MTDTDDVNEIIDLLTSLIDSQQQYWSLDNLRYLRTSVECGEYGDPFENIIALALMDGYGFDSTQMTKVEALISLMEMEDSEWIAKLRQPARRGYFVRRH